MKGPDRTTAGGSSSWPRLGCGLGLRAEHYNTVTESWPLTVDWFEAITENYMDSGGRPVQILEKVRSRYPIGLHGVSLSIGSCDPLDRRYLERLKALARRIDPAIVSDHLCWSSARGRNLHDLLPLPFTEEALTHVIRRIHEIQEFLGRRILLENVSTYLTFKHSYMPEWEFLSEVSRRSGCGILLDLNNIYVNARNHDFDARTFIDSVPAEAVGQFHLAGHTSMGKYLFDTHNRPVIEPVWDLYRYALERFGPVTTLIEWDADIPPFDALVEELDKARKIYKTAKNKLPLERSSGSAGDAEGEFSSARRPPKDGRGRKSPAGGRTRGPVTALANIQSLFKESILPSTGTTRARSRIAKLLNRQGGEPGKKRLSVYAEGYTARIHESLSETYPAVKHLLGHQAFLKTVRDYARQYPSRHYNLNWAGSAYPRYLKTSPGAKRFPFLADLAELEWKISESFHAPDSPAADLSGISALSEAERQTLRMQFQPSLKLVLSKWPVFDLWNARTQERGSIDVEVSGRPQNILVHKKGVMVRCEVISREQALLLKELLAGKTLSQALERFATLKDPSRLAIGEWFAGWTAKQLICGLSTRPALRRRSKKLAA